MRTPYLICLEEPSAEVFEVIKSTWPKEHHIELNDTQMLVAHRNGGKSVYDSIQKALDGKLFRALVVRVGAAHHGYQPQSRWDWLESHISE